MVIKLMETFNSESMILAKPETQKDKNQNTNACKFPSKIQDFPRTQRLHYNK